METNTTRTVGYAKITATVSDSSDALYTPCTYKLRDVIVVEGPLLTPIDEIVSFRGRFCEQVPTNQKEPTTIEAQGKVELVTDIKTGATHYRLIIGGKPTDYMVVKNQNLNLNSNVLISKKSSFFKAQPLLEDNDDNDDDTSGICGWVLSFRNKPE